jgi:hypothetical protein
MNRLQILCSAWKILSISKFSLKITRLHFKKKKCIRYSQLKAIRSMKIRRLKEKITSSLKTRISKWVGYSIKVSKLQ